MSCIHSLSLCKTEILLPHENHVPTNEAEWPWADFSFPLNSKRPSSMKPSRTTEVYTFTQIHRCALRPSPTQVALEKCSYVSFLVTPFLKLGIRS